MSGHCAGTTSCFYIFLHYEPRTSSHPDLLHFALTVEFYLNYLPSSHRTFISFSRLLLPSLLQLLHATRFPLAVLFLAAALVRRMRSTTAKKPVRIATAPRPLPLSDREAHRWPPATTLLSIESFTWGPKKIGTAHAQYTSQSWVLTFALTQYPKIENSRGSPSRLGSLSRFRLA